MPPAPVNSQLRPLTAQGGWGSRPQPRTQVMGSSPTYSGGGPTKAPADCVDEECAEEECDPDQCGDEARGPRPENTLCGIETRPLLPIILSSSTVVGAYCMLLYQIPILNALIGNIDFVLGVLEALFALLYCLAMFCMLYCTCSDPGVLTREHTQAYTALEELNSRQGFDRYGKLQEQPPLPKRAHKTWQYRYPVRRYDHYCRWVCNCIGLLNHRSFFIMVAGLVLIGILGTAVDVIAVVAAFVNTDYGAGVKVSLLFHLAYSVALLMLAGPILRIHIGLVARNELASEWKQNLFYVVKRSKHGENIPVNELSDDEFNARFDTFSYDKQRNTFDRGWYHNILSFWFTSRDSKTQLGEF